VRGVTRGEHLAEFDAGDVLVVGAGASGLTSASLLVERGLSVSVVDHRGVGAGQSGHHHGLVHRGYLYVGAPREFVDALARGRAAWDRWLDGAVPASEQTYAAFWDRWQARQAMRWWHDVGLSADLVEPPIWMRSPLAVFATGEKAFDFTSVWHHMLQAVGSDRTVTGEVVELQTKAQRVVGARIRLPDGSLVVARAGRYLIAAGCGIESLIRSSGKLSRRLVNRRSFMLLLSAANLPLVTMLTPEATHTGLFTGARRGPNENTWLVGDHVSHAGVESVASSEASWARATIMNLRSSTYLLDQPGVHVGVYTAPKAELRVAPRRIGQWSIDSYDLTNCLVATPTKLTFAAAMAEETVEALLRAEANGVRSGLPPLRGAPLAVVPERWHSVSQAPVEEGALMT
jgi:glycine/D-amino acid oxidase-like deaminating enzyme